ncbi:MAG: DUF2066 domain-containing protein [Gammaproteobacteria bacterium]|nr:DUF2066 domain-containing protein [Gammaproteobacteria bacterium]NND39094.1 DUF2066 domain-containing protein [Pseudomonadales bacterium]NNM10400.1 DUF2066 domain-containing protein [Pseudomonadales bacterium]
MSPAYRSRAWPARSGPLTHVLLSSAVLALAALAAALPGSQAQAGETRFVDLFSASVAVTSRSAAERRDAAKQALQTVFSRITGAERPASQYPQLGSALGRAERMVSGYQYQPADGEQLQLQFSFNQSAVRSALDAAGAPWWSANRPIAEVWLVEQQGKKRRFVTSSSNPELYRALQQTSARTGIPLRLPAEQGDTRLSSNRAWQMSDSDIIQAVSRGNIDAALIGRVERSGDSWRGQWKRYQNGQISSKRIQARSAQAVAEAGLQPLASNMARRYALSASGVSDSQAYQLSIDGLSSPRDYLAMIVELENIAGISGLTLLEVSGSQCRFSFNFNGSIERARSQLAMNARLADTSLGSELSFNWRR